MGFDVTFHPVSPANLQRYCFDIAVEPDQAQARAAEIAGTAGKQQDLVEGVLSRIPGFVEELRRGEGDFGSTVAMAAAAVAGYIHPFWYARGSALSFLAAANPEVAGLLTSLTRVAAGPVAELRDDTGGLLGSNYTASGMVLPEHLEMLSGTVERLASSRDGSRAPILEVFDEEGLDSLRRAIAYARQRGLGLMEATDLVVPLSGESYTDADNLRAHFLKNVEQTMPGRPTSAEAAQAGEPVAAAGKRARSAARRAGKAAAATRVTAGKKRAVVEKKAGTEKKVPARKSAAGKTRAGKTRAGKAPVRKAPARKAAARKATGKKKVAARKAITRKAAARKATARRISRKQPARAMAPCRKRAGRTRTGH